MSLNQSHETVIPDGFIDAIRAFPTEREVEHCGTRFTVPSLDIYARCPKCAAEIKVRAFTGGDEIEDLFDAFLAWLRKPQAQATARKRQAVFGDDDDE